MADWREMTFSQLALTVHQACPLRFRYRYIDKLYWSAMWGMPSEQREGIDDGQLFHLLARRYYSGLPVGDLAGHPRGATLRAWVEAMQRFLPYDPARQFYPECELRLNRPGFKLVAKFDLLVVDPDGHATIYDWKTERPSEKSYYQRLWQTTVYRYMLAEAGGAYSSTGRFRPEQVRMVYFHTKAPAQVATIDYTTAQFHQDAHDLQERIAQILQTSPAGFKAVATPDGSEPFACSRCEYRPLCHGRRTNLLQVDEEEYLTEATLNWDDLIGGDLP